MAKVPEVFSEDFVYGTDHVGVKWINIIPFRPLPPCTNKVYWEDIEGGNHERFGPYRMYQLQLRAVEERETIENLRRSNHALREALLSEVENSDWRRVNDKLRAENLELKKQINTARDALIWSNDG